MKELSLFKSDLTDPPQIFDAHLLENNNLSPSSFQFSVSFYIKIYFESRDFIACSNEWDSNWPAFNHIILYKKVPIFFKISDEPIGRVRFNQFRHHRCRNHVFSFWRQWITTKIWKNHENSKTWNFDNFNGWDSVWLSHCRPLVRTEKDPIKNRKSYQLKPNPQFHLKSEKFIIKHLLTLNLSMKSWTKAGLKRNDNS